MNQIINTLSKTFFTLWKRRNEPTISLKTSLLRHNNKINYVVKGKTTSLKSHWLYVAYHEKRQTVFASFQSKMSTWRTQVSNLSRIVYLRTFEKVGNEAKHFRRRSTLNCKWLIRSPSVKVVKISSQITNGFTQWEDYQKINGLFKFEMDPHKNRWYSKTTIVLLLLLTSPKLIILGWIQKIYKWNQKRTGFVTDLAQD